MKLRSTLPFVIGAGVNGKGRSRGRLAFSLAAVLILAIAFFGTLLIFFPEQPLRDRIERTLSRQSGEEVTIGGLALIPPVGLRLTNIGWQPGNPDWPAVTVDTVRISPLWTTIVSGDSGAAIQATASPGTLEGRVTQNGNLEAAFAGIVLHSLFPADFNYLPEGIGGGHIKGSRMLLPDKRQAAFDLVIDQLAVNGLESLGASSGRLALGRMSVRGEVRGQTLDIQELRNSAGDVQVDGKAVLLLGSSPRLSRITARIDITPGPNLDPMLRDLLPLSGIKPDSQGTYRFRIGGTLAQPVLR